MKTQLINRSEQEAISRVEFLRFWNVALVLELMRQQPGISLDDFLLVMEERWQGWLASEMNGVKP